MGFAAHLIHACTVQRVTKATDRYNNETRETWEDHLTQVACRLVVKQQRVWGDAETQALTVTKYILLVPAGTDIRTDDRVVNIDMGDGIVDDGPYKVGPIMPRQTRTTHHLSVALELAG